MTLRNTGTPTGFGSLTAPLVARAMRRATTKDLAALRSVLEATERQGAVPAAAAPLGAAGRGRRPGRPRRERPGMARILPQAELVVVPGGGH